jgi:hypothetical protein
MGFNVGGIYVRADRITQQDVVDIIRDYWLKLGARPSSRDPLDFRPLSLAKTGELAFAIAPPLPELGGGALKWIAVYDSERYHCDSALACRLSMHFETDVWSFTVVEAVNDASAKRHGKQEELLRDIGSVMSAIAPLPHAFLYFNKLREELPAAQLQTFQWLAFEGIPYRPKALYSGPGPQSPATR